MLNLIEVIVQYSSFIFFVDQKIKNIALCKLFLYNNIKQDHHDELINLEIDNITIYLNHLI